MAELSPRDVVIKAQSADDPSPADVYATSFQASTARALAENIISSSRNDLLPATLPSPPPPAPFEIQDKPADTKLEILMAAGSQNELSDSHTLLQPNGLSHPDFEMVESMDHISATSISVDGNPRSDTEASKVDEIDRKDSSDGPEQTRPHIAKKSASFKPVSVTKNFLAKAGAPVVMSPKLAGEKTNGNSSSISTPSPLTGPRPRLVAKSINGLKSLAPKTTNTTSKVGKDAGPDPNQVWNRNRVATPQATPKHLTDEELRIQYGIQLASRPQEDADDKEAKWADIDDDEDDWAPETIEWNDGTKINLAQVDPNVALAEQAAAAAALEKEEEALRQKQMALKAITTVGPNATVLRLGSSQTRSGLGPKGSLDKPTLVSKPASSTITKSPWAALPPVEKVPPGAVLLQSQLLQPRFLAKDAHGVEAMAPPQHAKEIAADDFSRFLRDSQNTNPRELFNSHSGRYEPVAETRRSSNRKEGNFRAPAVLQRPSQGDPLVPAEPSAAFQPSRMGNQDASWTRRRASSNVSGESGHFARRFSLGRGLDTRNPADSRQRRDSHNDQSPLTPGLSSVQSQGQSITSQSPTLPGHASTANSPRPGSAVPVELSTSSSTVPSRDAVAAQKILMKEKREAAIRRKQEEEAREEAAKKERIRQKLETLGLTDEKMHRKPSSAKSAERAALSNELEQETKAAPAAIPSSHPKPPIPNATGQPQQYGMMKVHAAPPINGPHTSVDPKSLEKVASAVSATSEVEKPARVNGALAPHKSMEIYSAPAPGTRTSKLAAETILPPSWPESQPGPSPYPTWHTNGMTAHATPASKLWGPPSNHRALGNGDFQQSVQRPSIRQNIQPANVLPSPPQPIGPPKGLHSARSNPTAAPSVEGAPRSIYEEFQTIPSYPPTESRNLPMARSSSLQTPFPPSASTHTETPQISTLVARAPQMEARKSGVAAWASFSQNVAQHDARRNEVIRRDFEAAKADAERVGLHHEPQFKETWRQVQKSDALGSRHVVGVTTTQQRAPNSVLLDHDATEPQRSISGPHLHPHVRSRYQDIFEQSQRTHVDPLSIPSSPSPPPPETLEHPAFTRISHRPLVRLPEPKAKPIVRLPPTHVDPICDVLPISTPPSAPPAASNRAVSQPQSSTAAWQDRIYGLFKRKPNSQDSALTDTHDFSTSKVPLEVMRQSPLAAVSLPPQDDLDQNQFLPHGRQHEKDVDGEDALFEERDFGSVPTVCIPSQTSVRPWSLSDRVYASLQKVVGKLDATSVDLYPPPVSDVQRNNGLLVTVLIPGMAVSKTRAMPRLQPQSSPRPHHSHGTRKPRAGPRSRDISSTHSIKATTSPGATQSLTSGPGPQARAKGHHHATWARRVSGVVP